MLPVWAYVAPGHRWAPRADADGAVALTELAEEPLTLPARSFKARRVLDGAFEVAGLGPCAVTEANSGRVAQALVATGAGAAVVTEDPAFDLVPLRITTATARSPSPCTRPGGPTTTPPSRSPRWPPGCRGSCVAAISTEARARRSRR